MTENPLDSNLVLVQESALLHKLAVQLRDEPCIALDTESNSYYAYFTRVCLIQLSTARTDFIIDPLSFEDLSPLGEILADPRIEKVLHAASNDILGLKRDFRFELRNLFDTALACKLLGWKHLALAQILFQNFGIELCKKWQRGDWGRRPLRREQLEYARLDTHYLIPLRHRLGIELADRGLVEQAREAFERECEQEIRNKPFDPNQWRNIRGAGTLDGTGKKVLKALFIHRDKQARKLDRAPFRLLSNEALLHLAGMHSITMAELRTIKGLPKHYRNGPKAERLLEVIHRARAGNPGTSQEELGRDAT